MSHVETVPRSCEVCNQPITGQGKRFCSRACNAASRSANWRGRFWSRVDKSGGSDACWLWTGTVGQTGYGNITCEGKSAGAHRVSWELTNGSIPHGLYVCHHCDVPLCVNPAHLFIGTHADNMADMAKKNLQLRVESPREIDERQKALKEPFPGFEAELQGLSEDDREVCPKCNGRGWKPTITAYQRVYRRLYRKVEAAKALIAEHEGSGT